ncbi:MAG: hypothetical protein M3N14_08210 [Bacteroidota bacterium]|nr:hypothetical protein [Bacteroidota bacterium]
MKILLLYFTLTLVFLENCKSQSTHIEQKTTSALQKSYIEENVPDNKTFDGVLKRDLTSYFSPIYKDATVQSELLRQGATQSGVAYPKFYLWIKIYQHEKLVNQGAVRVAAIEKKKFEVTDFVSILEITNSSKDIYSIFPAMVCEKIKSHLK